MMLPVKSCIVGIWNKKNKKKIIRSVQNQTTPICTGAAMADEDDKWKQIEQKWNLLSKLAVFMNHDAKKWW